MPKNLMPDPPLANLPALPDDSRWRILPRDNWAVRNGFDDIRRVYVDRKVNKSFLWFKWTKWVAVDYSTWRVSDGLGDFDNANAKHWYKTNGLASTCGYVLRELGKIPKDNYLDVHGVSKL